MKSSSMQRSREFSQASSSLLMSDSERVSWLALSVRRGCLFLAAPSGSWVLAASLATSFTFHFSFSFSQFVE